MDETGDGGRGGVFASFSLWQQASQTGAQLLWRVRANYRLPVETALPDGSYLSTFYASTADQRRRTDGCACASSNMPWKITPSTRPTGS